MSCRKILIVDDEAEFAEMIRMRLEANGYEVATAPDGAAGLAAAASGQPSMILLDVMMPGMDGFETLHRLRQDEATRRIPVVMLTARRESKFMMRSQELRAADYLMKPCDASELLAAVRKHAR